MPSIEIDDDGLGMLSLQGFEVDPQRPAHVEPAAATVVESGVALEAVHSQRSVCSPQGASSRETFRKT